LQNNSDLENTRAGDQHHKKKQKKKTILISKRLKKKANPFHKNDLATQYEKVLVGILPFSGNTPPLIVA
jgi:hypothetical protein